MSDYADSTVFEGCCHHIPSVYLVPSIALTYSDSIIVFLISEKEAISWNCNPLQVLPPNAACSEAANRPFTGAQHSA